MTIASDPRDRPAPAGTRARILDACRALVLAGGYAALSTRKVADAAGVPLSQIHYHFGSKSNLVLATLEAEDARLVDRQAALYATDELLSVQWARACDYLDDDLDSGYVRLLQEMLSAEFSDAAVRESLHTIIGRWQAVLIDAIRHHVARGLRIDPFTPEQVNALIGATFFGAETLILAGREAPDYPIRGALRAIGALIARAEAASPGFDPAARVSAPTD